jgi:predicted O-methyltransferase YrrM
VLCRPPETVMDVHDLIREAPRLHVDMGWRPVSLQASDEVLLAIAAAVRPEWATLETGAGVSTVVFAMKGSAHTAIVPAASEVERIRTYCAARGVSTARVTFHIAPSEQVLPALVPTALDLVLIDGSHAFPAPFIDWYYTAARLKVGGMLVIDDTHLWTGRVLREFLAAEDAWTLREEFPMRAAVFVKTASTPAHPEWTHQPFVVRHSRLGGTFGYRWRKAFGLMRRGQVRALAREVRRFAERRSRS